MTRLVRLIGLHKILLALADFVVLLLVAETIMLSRQQFTPYSIGLGEPVFFAISSLVAVVIFREIHLYRHRLFTTRSDQLVALAKGMLYVGILEVLAIFLIKDAKLVDYSRINVAMYIGGGWLALSLFRVGVFRHLLLRSRRNHENSRRVLAVGAGRAAQELATRIHDVPELGLSLVGFVDDDPALIGRTRLGVRIYGGIETIKSLASDLHADEIYVAINEIPYERLLEIIDLCRHTGLPVTVTTDHVRIVPDRIGTNEFDYIESLTLRPRDLDASWHLKRAIDIVGASILLLVLSPIMAAIAVAVKLTSSGPVIYRSKVVGRNGRLFTWFKYRTMRADRDDRVHREHLSRIIRENGSTKKLENDPRVTFVGRLLRKFSLDELPQLFNVLRGEMSLIGPRPCLQYEYEHFDEWHKQRFMVTPGMTGLWQVVGRNKRDVTFNDSIILDLYYIRNYSFWLDMKIAIRTIPAVLFGRDGA